MTEPKVKENKLKAEWDSLSPLDKWMIQWLLYGALFVLVGLITDSDLHTGIGIGASIAVAMTISYRKASREEDKAEG